MLISPIMSKACKRMGIEYQSRPTEYEAEIELGKSITVRKIAGYNAGEERTFRVGDTAEYDSYNLRYLGEIVQITAKSVTIKPQYGGKVKRLNLEAFAWRHYKWDLQTTLDENADTSMTI